MAIYWALHARISGKGVHKCIYKGVEVRFADLIYPMKQRVSLRTNYFIFIGYLNTGAGRGTQANPQTPSGFATERKLKKNVTFVRLFDLLFNVPVNSYGQAKTVSGVNHTFSWASSD